jgi:predicted deacetylase
MKINISIDDVCPHPQSSVRCLDRCFDLLNKYPDIKFTLFIPTAYRRNSEEPAYELNTDFIKSIKELPPNFELGYHGHFHGNKSNPEFYNITEEAALECLQKSKQIFELVGISIKPIFRPPAFHLSPGGFAACKTFGINCISLYPQGKLYQSYKGENLKFERVVYINVHPREIKSDKSIVYEDLNETTHLDKVSIMYHACEWDRNYFSPILAHKLECFLENKPQFCFLEDL